MTAGHGSPNISKDDKNMKILLIQPPQWYPVSPHSAVPLLKGQLIKAGFDATASDLNVKFFNEMLTDENVTAANEKARADMAALKDECESADLEKAMKSGSYEEKTRLAKYFALKKFYAEHGAEAEYISTHTTWAKNAVKTPEDFFIPEKMAEAMHILRLALRFLSMPYAPNELDLDNYFAHPLYKLSWESVRAQLHDKSVNMFYDYLEDAVKGFAEENYDAISLSLTDLSQLIPVFTLAFLIKKYTSAKVIVGGNYATQISEDMMKHSEIFTDYVDFLSIGDGELSFIELCEYIDGKRDIKNVSNLVYFNEEKNVPVSTGFSCLGIDMNELAYADYSDYDLTAYFTPEPVFPVQLSKGCYWGKCSFCDYHYGQQGYHPKTIERIIAELKYYIDAYGASKFIFVDECIPPVFYNKLALAITEAGLKLNFYSFARLEDGYTPEVLENLYTAGARLFMWGYECESLRVMQLMNKGINAEHRLDILTSSAEAGIWNNGLFIFGYPTETPEEIEATMATIRNNRRIIPSVTLSNFALKKHSLLKEHIGENGVLSYEENGEFYTVYRDTVEGVDMQKRRSYRRDFQFEFLDKNANSLWAVVFSDFDHLLLYLSKYGCDYVRDYRSEKRIAPEFR